MALGRTSEEKLQATMNEALGKEFFGIVRHLPHSTPVLNSIHRIPVHLKEKDNGTELMLWGTAKVEEVRRAMATKFVEFNRAEYYGYYLNLDETTDLPTGRC